MMGKQKRGVKSSNDADDLATLTDDNLSACLRNRYDTSRIYTLLGSSRLVAVNPYKPLSINDDNVGLEYVAAYKDLQQQQPRPQPHLFDLVNRAYFYMRRTGTDQAMVISGQSGSGKTQIRNLIIRHLVRLSSHKKESKTQTQLVHSQKVLDAFGSAATALSNEASRYGYYAEVQFSERGRMVGAKTIHYCLEKSRLTAASPREGNFSVLYQLVAGATPEERSALHLQSQQIEQYNYLAKYKRPITPADAEDFTELKAALKLAGFRRDHTTRIVQLLAAILHLGNLVFVDPEGSQNNQDAAYVKNTDILDLVADFLGVDPRALEIVLVFKTTMIRKDVTTLILNAEQARLQRDELAKTLYSLLFAWMVERINDKLCVEDNKFSSFIGVLDLPGPHYTDEANRFHSFIVNVATERIQSFLATQLFSEAELSAYDNEGIAMPRVTSGYQAADVLDLLYRPSRGVCTIINDMSENAQKRQLTDADMVDSLVKYNGNNALFSTKTAPGSQQRLFTIQHFGAPVTYDPNGFLADNSDQVAVDFVSLFRGGAGMPSSWNAFLVDIWGKYLQTESHPRNEAAVVSAHQKPTRSPSVRQSQRKKKTEGAGGNASEDPSKKAGILAQVQKSLDDLTATFQEAKLWTVYCIRPNDSQSSTQFDTRIVDAQIRGYGLLDIARKVQIEYAISYTHQEFLDRYAVPLQSMAPGVDRSGRLPRAQMEAIAEQLGMDSTMMAVGTTKVFLADSTWRLLEDRLRAMEKDEQRRNRDASKAAALAAGPPIEEEDEEMMGRDASHDPEESLLQRHMTGSSRNASPTELHAMTAASAGLPPPPSRYHSQMMDEQRSFYSEDEYYYNDGMSSSRYHDNDDSVYGSESYINTQDTDPKGMMLRHPAMNEKENLNATEEDESSQTPGRKRWLFLVWALTWWIPTPFLVWCGRMKRKDVRIAWREKVALCIIILLLCAFVIWFLVFFGELVCPHQAVFSDSELQSHSEKDDAYVAIRGEVFDLTSFAPRHYVSGVIPTDSVLEYGGTDATDLFPVQVSALCQGVTGSVDPSVPLTFAFNNTDDNAKYHDFTYSSYPYQPDWYYQQMTLLRKQYKVGNMGYEPHEVYVQATEGTTVSGIKTNRQWAIIDNHIYDLTLYNMGGRTPMAPPGETPPSDVDVNYMDSSIVQLFREKSGLDITEDFNKLPLDSAVKERQLVCLRNLFFVGLVDTRNSARCQFSTYLLLIITCLLCAVMVFKFLAAFRLGSARAPEELDKFVICQVTCYTEDEESLRKTIDSIATLRYDDKRKLLFVICDGMIVGSGNDRPTPRIVLDILGVDPQVDPEPLSFQSVGEGQKQHNMGKIYSGLYEVSGHVVPYLVVVKCGKPTERQKPGNRGKRDSQLILMQFLNRVHFDAPMSPLQLEMYHQMKNVIGVSPSMYDFVLMVDADTEVMPDGLNNLVSSMAHDSKIIGICGETTLANEKATWATMIQVYEYFISHHMTKAFESLFSTVTCLPGCFTMYRIRTVDGKRALFCSNEIIEEYAVNKVDTLHKKNLLHLGEDRYLTTLLLKHFPTFKTKFTPDAKCQTNVPDTWNVLVSQRRRWINSTIHNLGELAFLPRLCGFCCFSMRFVVMLDLISTLVMPAIVGYLGYLIYKLSTLENQVPILTIIVIAGTYGLQALLFIVKRRWEYILWMLVSILAIPVFWFYIPIYAYWHFDDFSWGNTRIVVGEKGKKTTVADEGEFDPKSIPLMTWSQYEKMLLAEDYWDDNMSQGSSRSSYTHRSRMRAGTPMLGGSGAVGGGAESVYGGGGGGDNMSMYTHSMMLNPQPQHPRASQASFFPDSGSMMMPSSASIPMMPYPSQQLNTPAGRSSMASFGPDAYLNQQRQSSRPSLMPSSSSFVMPPPPASVHNDGSSQSLLMEEFSSTQGPTNEEILAEVKRILSTADLTKVTKKQVREELSAIFGVSMASRKDYINACIENVLQGRM